MRYERVLYKEPNIQSRASLILLKREYIRNTAYYGYQGWLRFRWETLSKILLDKGYLECYYCGKKPLLIEEDNNHPMISTLDHIIPRSKGGAEYDLNNLVVACRPCNAKKKDTILSKDSPKDFIFQKSPSVKNYLSICNKSDSLSKRTEFCNLNIGDKFSTVERNPQTYYVKTGFTSAARATGGKSLAWALKALCFLIPKSNCPDTGKGLVKMSDKYSG